MSAVVYEIDDYLEVLQLVAEFRMEVERQKPKVQLPPAPEEDE